MALTKKDLQEVVGESEKRLTQRLEATEKRLEEQIQGVRSDVKILENVLSKRIENTDRKIDNLTELATDTLTAVSSVADNVPSLEEHKELKERLDEIDQRALQ